MEKIVVVSALCADVEPEARRYNRIRAGGSTLHQLSNTQAVVDQGGRDG
jgi:hypothetical protein